MKSLIVLLSSVLLMAAQIKGQATALAEQPGVTMLTPGAKHAMHAYFDICPESPDGTRIIYFEFNKNYPGYGRPVIAGINGEDPQSVGEEVFAHGHDAARQMWIDNETIAYSAPYDHITHIVDLNTGNTLRTIQGELLNYSPVNELGLGVGETESNGVTIQTIFTINVATGDTNTILTANDLASAHSAGEAFIDNKYVNIKHPKWSPDAEHLMFKVKAKEKDGDHDTIAKDVFVCNPDGSEIKYVSEKANHHMWVDDDHYLAYDQADDVAVYNIHDGSEYYLWDNALGIHGSTNAEASLFVTDIFDWPSSNEGAVLLYDTAEGEYQVIAAMQMPGSNYDYKVHPHPVWSRDGKRIYFNSEDDGTRRLYCYELSDSVVSSVDDGVGAAIPESIELINYPNPFNSETQIAFTIPEPGSVRISLFNLLGEQIALVGKGYLAPGRYTHLLNASNLSSGSYIVAVSLATNAGRFISEQSNILLLK